LEHLLNCHGEWTALLGLLYALPVLGVYARAWFPTHNHEDQKE
jgi:hypothetical protein